MKESLSRIIILTKRDFKEILRDPLSLIFTIGMPLLLEIFHISWIDVPIRDEIFSSGNSCVRPKFHIAVCWTINRHR